MIQIPLKVGHHRPASETPISGVPMMAQHGANDGWLGSFMIYQGIWTSIIIDKKPYIFVIFQVGGGYPDPMPPSGHVSELLKL